MATYLLKNQSCVTEVDWGGQGCWYGWLVIFQSLPVGKWWPKFKSSECPYYLWSSMGYHTLPPDPMFLCYTTCPPLNSQGSSREQEPRGEGGGAEALALWRITSPGSMPAFPRPLPFLFSRAQSFSKSSTFFVRELTRQWQWDGCNFS